LISKDDGVVAWGDAFRYSISTQAGVGVCADLKSDKIKFLGFVSKPLSGGLTSAPLFPVCGLCGKIFGVGASEKSCYLHECVQKKIPRNTTYESMSVVGSHDDESVVQFANLLKV
jgi:hypothetical protein